jgi:putative membrane protein
MFIDFVTLLLLNMTAGLVVFGWFLIRGIHGQDNNAWAPAFGAPGLIALVFGAVMTVTWPLPGPYNIIFGEMSVLFGGVYLGAAWALAKGWSLRPLSIVTLVAGAYAILIGRQIIALGLTKAPLASGAAFILTGAGGVLLPLVLCLKKVPAVRLPAAAVVLAAAVMWGAVTCLAYQEHMVGFDAYLPHPTLKKDSNAPEAPATKPAPAPTTGGSK